MINRFNTITDNRDRADHLDHGTTFDHSKREVYAIAKAGAVGGLGNIALKLTSSGVVQETQPANRTRIDWVPVLPFWSIVEFGLYAGASVFLGAVSAYTFIYVGDIATGPTKRNRCLAIALLCGLFFPATIGALERSFRTETLLSVKTERLEELQETTSNLESSRDQLASATKKTTETLTKTTAASNLETKGSILLAKQALFDAARTDAEKQEMLGEIIEIGINNQGDASSKVAQDVRVFLNEVSERAKESEAVRAQAREGLLTLSQDSGAPARPSETPSPN